VKQCVGISVALFAVLLAAAPAALAEPASVVFKKRQASEVLAEVQTLDANLAHAIESYNAANERLGVIQADLKLNTRELGIARFNLKTARTILARRLVALYTNAGGKSTLDVVLGSSSLGQAIDGVETASRVSNHDTVVLQRVKAYRTEVASRRQRLKRARAEQSHLVAQRAAQRASIESRLTVRRQLLASIQNEIEQLQAQEAARQRALEAQARARLQASAETASAEASPFTAAVTSTTDLVSPGFTAPPARYGGVVGIAMQYLGVPYAWGGASPAGFDCSGFVMYVYGKMGVSLPHYTGSLYGMGSPVSRMDLQPGDLVFFNGLGHVGIYIGGNQMVHAPHTGDVVKISPLTGWYDSTYVGARRI
jgi:cell wall-associated NlpC family hydrolase